MADARLNPVAQRQVDVAIEERRLQAGWLASERLRAAFDRFLAMAGEFPRVGTVIHRIGDDEFRQFPVEGFVIRFWVSPGGTATIVDVRHGSMREPSPDVLEQQAFQPDGDQS